MQPNPDYRDPLLYYGGKITTSKIKAMKIKITFWIGLFDT